jgi:hypothetical protein
MSDGVRCKYRLGSRADTVAHRLLQGQSQNVQQIRTLMHVVGNVFCSQGI